MARQMCECGLFLPPKPTISNIYRCRCGRKYLWKLTSRKWIFAGFWK